MQYCHHPRRHHPWNISEGGKKYRAVKVFDHEKQFFCGYLWISGAAECRFAIHEARPNIQRKNVHLDLTPKRVVSCHLCLIYYAPSVSQVHFISSSSSFSFVAMAIVVLIILSL